MILIAIFLICLIVLGSIFYYKKINKKIREAWLTKWNINDHIQLRNFIDIGSYEYDEGIALKWSLDLCEVKITKSDRKDRIIGNIYYFETGCAHRNFSLESRERENKFNNFMSSHSQKADERDKKLESILKSE